ncbi:FK506-binding protein 15 isoform X2 [Pelobates fuscus]|uniref:FK506-binding protein 15 isoform X2 n=1 Tax=Pelobates fuscus TaxID=191477 RepID=UPI002FE4342E
MFGAEEDDTDFLSPTGGAKLASLFGMDQTASRQGNESFQYTAPKQPKKGPGAAGPKSPKPPGSANSGPAPSVLFATAVHAYRFTNGQYVKQGKFGAAVLGNHTTKEYRILLYISQQQQVTAAKIHPGFVFMVQPNNYATFYDDQRQNWSVMFESETSAIDFSKQMCIAKCNSSPALESVLTQDLLPGEGQGADVGDLLEVAYTGWLYQNQGLGQMFDSNVQKEKMLRLKLGSGKVIKGWEEGMQGMKKGGRRLLIIPPALGYGSQGHPGRIPSNSTLIFEVEVKRIKLKDLASDRQSVGSRDSPVSITDSLSTEFLPQPPTSVPPHPGEPAVRTKSNSISEQLANPDAAKAKLISRMARMGQPMLPFLAGSSTPGPDSSDSEIEDPNLQRLSPHPAVPLPVRPTPQIGHTTVASHLPASVPPQQAVLGLQAPSAALLPVPSIHSQAFPSGTPPAPGFQPYSGLQYSYSQTPVTQLQPMAPVYPPQLQQSSPFQGDITSFLMTEARQQSTEIRMSISKVIDKIDNLASKVDSLQKENPSGASHLLPGISTITMESSMIMNNIQRIMQENERLKQEVLEKSSRIEEQNVKIGELITRNQRFVEQSNLLMEQRNDSLQTTSENTQARVLHAVQEKHALHTDLGRCQAKVAEDLAAATGQLSKLQLEVTAYQKKEMDLRMQLAAALQDAEKLSSLQVQLIEVQELSEQMKSRVKVEKDGRRQLEVRLAALEEEVSDLKAEKRNLEKSLVERKKRSQQERQHAEEELEELRRTHQEEIENLRQLLKKMREQAASEQRSSAHEIDLERLSELEERAAQVQPLRDKCAKLQSHLTTLTEEYKQIRAKMEEQEPAADSTEEVKTIMNGVFQSLRREFELEETYSGRVVLGTIMNTIKATTLQLLNKQPDKEPAESDSEHEDEEIEVPRQVIVSEQEKPSSHVTVVLADEHWQRREQREYADQSMEKTQSQGMHVVENDLSKDKPSDTKPVPSVLVENESEVEVIQEVMDPSSALVHMVSSDMPEYSSVSYIDNEPGEGTGESLQEGKEINGISSSPVPEVLTQDLSNENKTIRKEALSVPSTVPETEVFNDGRQDGPPLLESDEDNSSPIPPTEDTSSSMSGIAAKGGPGQPQSKTHKSPLRSDSDEEDLFKLASPRAQKPKQEDEEDEEVSLKGRPPPAPLFGDEDDDDDDLGW